MFRNWFELSVSPVVHGSHPQLMRAIFVRKNRVIVAVIKQILHGAAQSLYNDCDCPVAFRAIEGSIEIQTFVFGGTRPA